jgi:molybdenum-dependent DNA-binding transcriptional regulator ModE
MDKKLVATSEKEKSLQVTAQAKTIIERFEKLEKDVEKILSDAEQDFKKLFTMDK